MGLDLWLFTQKNVAAGTAPMPAADEPLCITNSPNRHPSARTPHTLHTGLCESGARAHLMNAVEVAWLLGTINFL